MTSCSALPTRTDQPLCVACGEPILGDRVRSQRRYLVTPVKHENPATGEVEIRERLDPIRGRVHGTMAGDQPILNREIRTAEGFDEYHRHCYDAAFKASRQDFIAAARSLLGSGYAATGAREGAANCVGLWAVALRKVGGLERLAEKCARGAMYRRPVTPGDLLRQLRADRDLLDVPVRQAQPGDLLLVKVKGVPQHMALITEPDMVLHADMALKKVVEHRLPPEWRPVAAFRIRDLA